MIRAWLARRRPQPGVHRAVDEVTFLGAQFDVRDAQIEGLHDTITELRAEAVRLAAENARLQASLATALAMQWLQQGAANARRAADEPTVVTSTEQLRRARPAGPALATEQYRRQP